MSLLLLFQKQPGGTLNTSTLTASVSFTGSQQRSTAKALTAALSFTGTFVKTLIRSITATLSFTGNTLKRLGKALTAGALSFSGSVTKATVKTPMTASVSFVGNQAKLEKKILSAALSFAGSITKVITHSLPAASLNFVGSIGRGFFKILGGVLSFSGAFTKVPKKSYTASLSFVGNQAKAEYKILTAALSFSGKLTRTITKSTTATLSFTGSLTSGSARFVSLSGSLSFSGGLARSSLKSLQSAFSFNNLVNNWSFESGTGTTNANFSVPGWAVTIPASTSTVSVDGAVAQSGSQSIKLAIDASNTNNGIKQSSTFAVSANTTYILSLYCKSDTSGQLQIQLSDGGTNFVQTDGITWNTTATYQAINTSTIFTNYQFIFTTAPGQTQLRISDLKRSGSGTQTSRTFWIDNVSIVNASSLQRVNNKGLSAALSFTGAISRSITHSLTAAISFAGNVVTSATRFITLVGASLSFSAQRYAEVILSDSPLLFWRFDEKTGTVANDISGNSNNGTYNSVTLGATSALTNDPDSAVTLADAQSITSSYNPFVVGSQRTFEYWMNLNTIRGFDTHIQGGALASRPGIFTNGSGGVVWCTQGSAANTVTYANPLVGKAAQWLHFVLTYDDTTKVSELFINGVSQGQKTSGGGYTTAGNLAFGQAWNGFFYRGGVDELAIYNGILSPSRIAAHYQAGITGPGLVKSIRKPITALLNFSGSIARADAKAFSAALSFTGNLRRVLFTTLAAASMSFTGAFSRRVNKVFAASVSFTGTFSRKLNRSLAAIVSFTGTIGRTIQHRLAAAVSFTGALTKRLVKLFIAALTPSGAMTQQVRKAFTASITTSGALTRQGYKTFTATLSLTGIIGRSFFKVFAASLGFIGTLGQIAKRLIRKSEPVMLDTLDNSITLEQDNTTITPGSDQNGITLNEVDDSQNLNNDDNTLEL